MQCPRCSNPLEEKSNSPNGGTLYVAEEMESCTEYFDGIDNHYKCPQCKLTVYIGKERKT